MDENFGNFLQQLIAGIKGSQPTASDQRFGDGTTVNGAMSLSGGAPTPTPDMISQAVQAAGPQPQYPLLTSMMGGDQTAVNAAAGLHDAPVPPPQNIMQQAAAPDPAPVAPNSPAPAPAVTPAAAPAPRQRHSLVDIIGHAADAIAMGAGETAGYQGALDARTAHQLASEDHARALVHDTLANAHTQQEIDASRATTGKTQADTEKTLRETNAAKYGAALRGLQAIQKANPNADIASIFPVLAKQAGLDDAGAANLLKVIQTNPGAIDGLAAEYEKQKAGGDGGNFGLNPFLATDGNGHTKAYQLGKDGSMHEIALPAGFQAATTTSVIDTGGNQVITDKRTGMPIRIIPKSGGPEKGETPITDAKGNIVGYSAVPGSKLQYGRDNPGSGGKGGAGAKSNPFTMYSEARTGLQNLLGQMDRITGDKDIKSATGLYGAITSHIPGTAAKRLAGNIATAKGQALTSAINSLKALGGGNLGFRMTQAEAIAFGNNLAGALDHTDQSANDYISNIENHRQMLVKQIQRMDEDAMRGGYVVRGPDGKLMPAPPKAALPPRATLTPKPRAAGAQPTVSNW